MAKTGHRLNSAGGDSLVRSTRRWTKGTEDQALLGLTAMRAHKPTSSFALCVRDDGSEDLEQRKIYQVLPDREAAREGHLRIVDESGEDYLYPSDLFVMA
jgi:hypothetical protein